MSVTRATAWGGVCSQALRTGGMPGLVGPFAGASEDRAARVLSSITPPVLAGCARCGGPIDATRAARRSVSCAWRCPLRRLPQRAIDKLRARTRSRSGHRHARITRWETERGANKDPSSHLRGPITSTHPCATSRRGSLPNGGRSCARRGRRTGTPRWGS